MCVYVCLMHTICMCVYIYIYILLKKQYSNNIVRIPTLWVPHWHNSRERCGYTTYNNLTNNVFT